MGGNWFDTFNAALDAEGLLDLFPMVYGGIERGSTLTFTIDDGSRYGRFVSIYRDERGMYERPVHYTR